MTPKPKPKPRTKPNNPRGPFFSIAAIGIGLTGLIILIIGVSKVVTNRIDQTETYGDPQTKPTLKGY